MNFECIGTRKHSIDGNIDVVRTAFTVSLRKPKIIYFTINVLSKKCANFLEKKFSIDIPRN